MRKELSASCPNSLYWDAQSLFERLDFFSFRFVCTSADIRVVQDRENESRFGATPVPGKIGMAMAGQGLHAHPPPRPPSHNFFGAHANPGNQLYVGNVRSFFISRRCS
jgi:hypothetical protein